MAATPKSHVRALVSDLGGGLLLAIGSDLGQIDAVEEAIASAFLWTVGLVRGASASAAACCWARAFLARVERWKLRARPRRSAGGDFGRRGAGARRGWRALDELAGTPLNRMLDRIGTLLESLRQVSSDIAHDLRTPLTRLYQRLEDARAHARSVAEYEAAVDAALAEAEGLLATFSALLRIAQVEGASSRAGFRAADLSAVVEAVADAYRPDAEAGLAIN